MHSVNEAGQVCVNLNDYNSLSDSVRLREKIDFLTHHFNCPKDISNFSITILFQGGKRYYLKWLAIINDSDYRKKVITRQLRIKPLSPLSSRELQCLSLISQGFKIKEVADKLHLSVETVNTHAKSIRQKLACKNITEAVTKAFSLRIL